MNWANPTSCSPHFDGILIGGNRAGPDGSPCERRGKKMSSKLLRVMAIGVLVPFSTVTLAMPAVQATAVVSTGEAIAQSRAAASSDERERVQAFLSRGDVAQQLARLGVDAASAQARVDALTDAEVAQLDRQIEQLPAGGSSVLGALVFIFVLLLITDILGFTKVFPFTRSMR